MNKTQFKAGDRVRGLSAHRGKTGTVLEVHKFCVTLIWDGGKRKSTIDKNLVALIEVGNG